MLPPVLNAIQVQAPPPGLGLVAEALSWSPLPTPAALAKLATTSLNFKLSSTACLQQQTVEGAAAADVAIVAID